MTKKFEVYKCNVCGNIVEVLHNGVGELVCCGQPMELKTENGTENEGKEKHVPVITKTDKGIKVNIGSVAHPMEDKHYIEWIEINEKGMVCRKHLNPGDNPSAEFNASQDVTVRAYCNVHGLWKN